MLHPLLAALFADLEHLGLRWTLLRLPSAPHAPTGDVDLLVDPQHLPALRTALGRHGFAIVPGQDQPDRTLAVAFDRPSASCLLLDITADVSFGQGRLETTLAPLVLDRAVQDRHGRLPCPADAFWLLVLHCLLDKGHIPAHYKDRLQATPARQEEEGPVAAAIRPFLPGDWSVGAVRQAAMEGRWDRLEELAAPLLAACSRSRTASQRMRQMHRRARRLARSPGLLSTRHGVSVALLGPDGVGKSTLAAGLQDTWPLASRIVYMGLWKSGDRPGTEVPGLAQLLRAPIAWARYSRGFTAKMRGELVIFDRYVHDARKPPAPPYAPLKRIYMWILAHSVPAPDLLLLLDAPGAVARARKDENSPADADREREEFLAIARQLDRVHVLDATVDAAAVRGAALEIIWERATRRWASRRPTPTQGAETSALPDCA